MKEIDISTKRFPNTFCLVDDDDYEWVKHFKWTPEQTRSTIYVCRSEKRQGRIIHIRMHRDILRARSFEQVDHVDGNGLINCKSNLRICNHITNQQNRIKRGHGKSGSIYKGVFYRRSRSDGRVGRCFAYITINKQRFHIGTFDTDTEAAKAYDSKALYYFKDRARLNFPASETIPAPFKDKK